MPEKLYPCPNEYCCAGMDVLETAICEVCNGNENITESAADEYLASHPELNPDWVKSTCRLNIPKLKADL